MVQLGVLAGGVRAGHGVALGHRRQGLRAAVVVLVLLAFLVGLAVHVTPAVARDYLAARGEVLARDLDAHGGLHVLVQRVELRQVGAHDQVVDVALALAEGGLAALLHGRHDAVVRGELLPLSAPIKADKAGRPLPRYQSNSYTLGNSEVLLMSDVSATSFDGRYFGPINRSQIKTVIRPVITW